MVGRTVPVSRLGRPATSTDRGSAGTPRLTPASGGDWDSSHSFPSPRNRPPAAGFRSQWPDSPLRGCGVFEGDHSQTARERVIRPHRAEVTETSNRLLQILVTVLLVSRRSARQHQSRVTYPVNKSGFSGGRRSLDVHAATQAAKEARRSWRTKGGNRGNWDGRVMNETMAGATLGDGALIQRFTLRITLTYSQTLNDPSLHMP